LGVFAAPLANDVPGTLDAIDKAVRDAPLPVAIVLLGVPEPPTSLGGAPVYALPEQAVTALGRAARYAAWRCTPLGTVPALSTVDSGAARILVHARPAGGQPPDVAADLLRHFGIPVLAGRAVTSADEAVAAADALGYPAVLKAADPNLVHKSDIGGVRLNLPDPAAVTAAYAEIVAA